MTEGGQRNAEGDAERVRQSVSEIGICRERESKRVRD